MGLVSKLKHAAKVVKSPKRLLRSASHGFDPLSRGIYRAARHARLNWGSVKRKVLPRSSSVAPITVADVSSSPYTHSARTLSQMTGGV